MRKTFFLLVTTLIGFWVIFLSLQNQAIYTHSFGFIYRNWQNENGERKLVKKPYEKLTNENFIQWDAIHYYQIKNHGYNIEKARGDYIFAFFPLFPFIWKITNLPPIGILFLNYLFFSASILILLRIFSETKNYFQNAVISLCLPSLIIFLIPYSEASFTLMVSIGIYGFVKNKYWIFFIGFLLASLTRPSFTFLFLSIISVEFFYFIQHRNIKTALKNTFLRVAPLIIGTAAVSLIQYSQHSGSLFKFIEVQKYWGNILAIPHNLRDWSHEGFAINIGVIFFVFLPSLIIIAQLAYFQLKKRRKTIIPDYRSHKDYLLILSMIYLIGNALFVILFRGGSLHCLFRFTICSPFFFILLYISFDYIKHLPVRIRFFLIAIPSVLSILVLSLAGYSHYWNFSDFGIFILIGVLSFWIFQDFRSSRFYKIGILILLTINMVWTTYLFNTYIINGWIFA